jgi:hypothetical protein
MAIFWIIYLFYDISKYSKKLNAYMSTQEINSDETNEIVRDRSRNGFYSVVNVKTGIPVNVYEDRQEILENIDKSVSVFLNKKKNGINN